MEYKSVCLELQEVPYKDFPGYDTASIACKFRQVIEYEGPVVDDFLELKVLKSYSIFQRGKLIAPFLRGILLSLNAVSTAQKDCDGAEHLVFWPDAFKGHETEIEALKFDGYPDYRPSGQKENMEEGTFRSIADFPHIEIFNAMKDRLSEGKILKRAVLLTETNHALGFLVRGRQIQKTLEGVLKTGISNGSFVYSRRTGTVRLRQVI